MNSPTQLRWTQAALKAALRELTVCGQCPIRDLQKDIEDAEIRRRGCTRRAVASWKDRA